MAQRVATMLLDVGRQAVAACSGRALVRAALAQRPSAANVVLAVGKAAGSMAQGARDAGVAARGLVVTKAPTACELEVLLAGHPWPDARSVVATERALALCSSLSEDDELLVLLSGGTSALIGGPIAGVSLDAARTLTSLLLRSGASIDEMNRVRRRLGAALGGRLRAVTKARVRALVLSDVLSGDLRTIGSGPLHADEHDRVDEAVAVARRVGASDEIIAALRASAPPPFAVDATIIGDPWLLVEHATLALQASGFTVDGATFVGDLNAWIDELAAPLSPGHARVRVGEPAITLTGQGSGGRAQHVALSLALRLLPDHAALALASDGSDGPTDAAGGVVDAQLGHAHADEIRAALRGFDSAPMLDRLGARVVTGPTGTNLTDLYIVARA